MSSNRFVVNGAAVNASAVTQLFAAVALAAAASCSFSATRVHPGAANLGGSASVLATSSVQYFSNATATCVSQINSPNTVFKLGSASATAVCTFAGVAAPALGGSVFPCTSSFAAVGELVVFGTTPFSTTAALSAGGYVDRRVASSLTSTATVVADPSVTVDGTTTMYSTGRFGSGGTVDFTVTGIRIVLPSAPLPATAAVMVASPTYKKFGAAPVTAVSTLTPGIRQTHQASAAGVGSASSQANWLYFAQGASAMGVTGAMTAAGLSSLQLAATPTATSAFAPVVVVRRFGGYVYANVAAGLSFGTITQYNSYAYATATAGSTLYAIAGSALYGSASTAGQAVCDFSAEAGLRAPDAIEIMRPAEDRDFIRASVEREFVRPA